MIQRRTPLRRKKPIARGRTPIRRVSKKRARQLAEYRMRRERFLREHPVCAVWLNDHGWSQCATVPPMYRKDERGNTTIATLAYVQDEGAPEATEVHHKNGRTGERLNEERDWLPVCRKAHEWIHANPSAARARGFLK